MANTLNMKFKASCGRQLTEENLKFLAGKAFRWVVDMPFDILIFDILIFDILLFWLGRHLGGL